MTRPIADHEIEDKPLDPAVERVRRKLVRFAVVNLLILFAALAAVVGALIWRTGSRDRAAESPGGFVEAPLAVPAGAQVLSHAAGEREVSLLLRLPDGRDALYVFSRANGAPVARHVIAPAP